MSELFDEVFVKQIGLKVVAVIKHRTTAEGKFLEGSSDNAGEYSTKPFVLPLSALNKMTGNKVVKAASKQKTSGEFQLFQSKTGNVWVWVRDGYKKIRELAGKDTSFVSMTFSGRYMRDLSLLTSQFTAFTTTTEIGWKSAENQRLARYHEKEGAGKSKRLHKILGMTKPELDNLSKDVRDYVLPIIQRSIGILDK